jgi:hypothetical protein
MPAHPRDTWPKPSTNRLLLAFLGAPASATALVVAPVAIGAALSGQGWVMAIPGFFGIFIIGFLFVALPLTVVFGIPLFLMLRKRVRLTFWASSLAGVAVLYLPLAIFLLILASQQTPSDGRGPGWLEVVEAFGVAAVLGSVAGFVFWLIAVTGPKPKKQDAAVVPSGAHPRPEEAESERVITENVA